MMLQAWVCQHGSSLPEGERTPYPLPLQKQLAALVFRVLSLLRRDQAVLYMLPYQRSQQKYEGAGERLVGGLLSHTLAHRDLASSPYCQLLIICEAASSPSAPSELPAQSW